MQSNKTEIISLVHIHLKRMKLLTIFLLVTSPMMAQIGTGQWRLHIPAYEAIDVAGMDGMIYAAYTSGVSEYDPSSGEISVWDAVNGLSDISISCLGYSPSDNSLFIGYENGNLDKLKNNSITNIPAINLAQVQGSKRINRMVAKDGYMYLATGFAIVKIDPVKEEVRDTYYPTNGNAGIVDLAFRNDTIFALTDDRMYFGLLSSPALADPNQWTEDTRVPVLTGETYHDIENVGGKVYVSRINQNFGEDSLFLLTASGMTNALTETNVMEIHSLQTINGMLAINYVDVMKVYNDDLSMNDQVYFYGQDQPNPNASLYFNGKYYIADGKKGLMEVVGISGTRIAITGPPKSSFFSMDWNRGRLAIAGGGLSSIFHTYSIAGAYTFRDEQWDLFDISTVSEWDNEPIYDFLCVAVNPTDPDEVAMGTFSKIPLTIVNDNGSVDTLSAYNTNLGFHSNGSGESFVSDLAYDSDGNLWVLNGMSDYPLKVYTKDKEWYTMNTGSSTINKFSEDLIIDGNGNKWFSLTGVGLVGLDDGGTPENPSDDEYVILNSGENTGALPSVEVNAIAADLDNEIWIGTESGFAVLYNSSGAFGAALGEYNAQRIKLEFEGNVEYVLGATDITAIEVDGANRKWFGTANAGIVLLSADGLDILEQHTVENSPLISNNIIDLELDQRTGELFIITDKGLVSYRTDATEGAEDYENVTVFPNPKRPEYDGPITIQGIKYDSDVRITDAAGRLVYQTTSNGGTATWNGRTLNGEKVTTGVYLIWTAPNSQDVKGRKVGKVLVVN